jgi:hypothetical protein
MQVDGGVRGGVRASADRAGRIGEERVAPEAGVPAAPLRVEDPKLCPPACRSEPVSADEHLGALPDDIPTEPDPRSTGQLKPERSGRGNGGRQLTPEFRRLDDDEQHTGPAGECGETLETVGQAGWTFRRMAVPWAVPWRVRRKAAGPSVLRQVDNKDVDRPAREERPGHRDAFVRRRGLEDDEPLQPDSPGHRLNWIQAPGKIHPGGNRAPGLGLCNEL